MYNFAKRHFSIHCLGNFIFEVSCRYSRCCSLL